MQNWLIQLSPPALKAEKPAGFDGGLCEGDFF
jgi:hypothetical protein